MHRRDFIEKSLIGGAALSFTSLLTCMKDNLQMKPMPKRKLGRADEMLSIIGFGGIVVNQQAQRAANEAVALAFDRGINYYDVAPTYGNAEERLGPALKPYRKNAFLACKTNRRKSADAEKELYQSLEKLKTDYFDLYQLHALSSIEDVDTVFGPGGAMEVFFKAKEEGKIRYLGFSAHSEAAALHALKQYDFDTLLFPINFVTWSQGNFGKTVLRVAKERNMGILALKALAYSRIPEDEKRSYNNCWYHPIPFDNNHMADLALRFTLSQSTTAAIPPGEPVYFWKSLQLAPHYQPLHADETEALENYAKNAIPLFKTDV